MSSQKSYSRALRNYLYIIRILPNGYARGEAFKNLARIYQRQDKPDIAVAMFLESYRFLLKPNEKAQILIEMNELINENNERRYKQAIVETLNQTINKDLKSKLETIYKRIL